MTAKPKTLTSTQQALVTDHLGLAHKIANGFKRLGTASVQTLEGVGYLALCESALTFDPNRGTAFSTLAYPRVRGAIADAARTAAYSGTGVYNSSKGDNGRKAFWKGEQNHASQQREVRLDCVVGEGTLGDLMSSQDLHQTGTGICPDLMDAIRSFGDSLTDPTEILVFDSVLAGRTSTEIARIEGCSRQWGTRMRANLLKKLKRFLAKQGYRY
jgi:hypothetical protein